jgi:hypothetical protein
MVAMGASKPLAICRRRRSMGAARRSASASLSATMANTVSMHQGDVSRAEARKSRLYMRATASPPWAVMKWAKEKRRPSHAASCAE